MESSLNLPDTVSLGAGRGGLARFLISTPQAEAEVYLHGAHVAHFQPVGSEPVFFLSTESYYENGRPIRGGVPVIFPWFGAKSDDATAPAHGVARTRAWEPESIEELADGRVELVLRLEPDAELAQQWGGGWVLRHHVTIGRELTMALEISNGGATDFHCEEALHTYFLVSDVHKIEVRGLEGGEYLTKIEDAPRKHQPAEPIRFQRETDRVYLNTKGAYTIVDPGLNRRIEIGTRGSQSAVVWNPWVEKSKTMADFGNEEWPQMVCVETGNLADNALIIAPGATHVTQTVIRLAAL